jgi:hypothetical protein
VQHCAEFDPFIFPGVNLEFGKGRTHWRIDAILALSPSHSQLAALRFSMSDLI